MIRRPLQRLPWPFPPPTTCRRALHTSASRHQVKALNSTVDMNEFRFRDDPDVVDCVRDAKASDHWGRPYKNRQKEVQELDEAIELLKKMPDRAQRLHFHNSWEKTMRALRNKLFFSVAALSSRNNKDEVFLNFGYSPPVPDRKMQETSHKAYKATKARYGAQLYHRCCTAMNPAYVEAVKRGDKRASSLPKTISLVKNKRVLDVGCFKGGGAHYMLKHLGARSVLGVDFSRTCIQFCKEQYKGEPNLEWFCADALRINDLLPPYSFDVITCIQTARHLCDAAYFFQVVHDLLKKNGLFILADKWFDEQLTEEERDPDDDVDEYLNLKRHLLTVGLKPQVREDLTDGFAKSFIERWGRMPSVDERYILVRARRWKDPVVPHLLMETIGSSGAEALMFPTAKGLKEWHERQRWREEADPHDVALLWKEETTDKDKLRVKPGQREDLTRL
ncbi:unnamed protein product [Vitrella brassicaformis CCMP3155]|uniref:Methyltransferase domain-containing protein n=1 Tax=Vitrella brassicaformis (strain CCMP3155) TaxID=1169540 RepID=A0A0G4E9Y7_VITBC|nr:unnamed protein product [Vitrella brassicaformis CCMP3155]|mmetsp:Transcript_19844/g.48105  ORF Transcript_19844/g.48105 Transcript_19844/m.48105 type:complete len:448 (-) Transcript_19844:1510-2853(-)|eukprot:CEL92740.1 unnamed protein product [Vitrella brassicaformis CCMP3155]